MIRSIQDYPSIQDAINASDPYDVVRIPPGRHEAGTLLLKSHLTLRLDPQAVLVAFPDISRYSHVDWARVSQCGQICLLGGHDLEDVSIEGDGIIEGNGHLFWENYQEKKIPHAMIWGIEFFKPGELRPKLLYFVNCRDLRIRGITIRNAPFYTIHALGCDQLEIDHVTVRNNRSGPNTDILDIDCCADVRITNCDLDGGDDAVAVKSDIAMLGRDKVCERLQISNNRLSSTCCGIRVGFEGDGEIRDLLFTDNIVYDTNKCIDILSIARKDRGIRHGARISNLIFSNCLLRNVRRAIHVWSGADEGEKSEYGGFIRHLLFSGIFADCSDASFAGGIAVSDLTFRDVRFTFRRDLSQYIGQAPVTMTDVWGRGYLEQPLSFHGVTPRLENVVCENQPGFRMFSRGFEEKKLVSSVDGTSQRYFVRHGKAGNPCFIILHGHGSMGDQLITRPDTAKRWTKFLIEQDFSIISPDLRGNAWMSEAAIRDLTDIIAAEKPILAWDKLFLTAGSMGGTGAFIFAARHPELPDGVAAFGAATDLETYLEWLKTQEKPILKEIARAIEKNHPTEAIRKNASVCLHAENLSMPIWYLHGGADEIIPPEQAHSFAKIMHGRTNFHFREIPGGNHDSPLRFYEETVKELLKGKR